MNPPCIISASSTTFSQAIAAGDIQTAMQMVQSNRVCLLDTQFVDQVKAVQSRNDRIAPFNTVLSGLNSYATQIDGTQPDSKPKVYSWFNPQIKQYERPLNDAIQNAGLTDLGFTSRLGQRTPKAEEAHGGSAGGVLIRGTNVVTGSTTKGEIDAAITKIKGMIDAESNN